MSTSPSTPTPIPIPSSPKLIPPITTITTTITTTNDAVSLAKKPQPIPWTHQETVNLIRAYQEKWYASKRGPLRASQWEEVAVVVAARCGYDFNHPSKSAVQCRHKMEKLRQRHRAEKRQRLLPNPTSAARTTWQFSGLMDELERGPMPISVQPMASLSLPFNYDNYDNFIEIDDDDDGGGGGDEIEDYKKSRSINYILSESQRHSKNKFRGIFREHVDDVDNEDDVVVDDGRGGGYDVNRVMVVNKRVLVSGLTSEIKNFAEKLIGMENLKMKMMRDTERCRVQMEKRRIEMILESQRRTIDSIGRAFGSSSKRMKTSEET